MEDKAAMRVLVVEDNPMNLELTTDILEAVGYLVSTAACGKEAIHLLTSSKIDLVLMDVQLPGLDGLAVTRLIKADPATQHIPVIALTAHAMQGDAETVYAAGCDDYISKPIEVNHFRNKLARYAANRPPSSSDTTPPAPNQGTKTCWSEDRGI